MARNHTLKNKYSWLVQSLNGYGSDEIKLSFDKVEEMLKSPLPNSAREHAAWWSNAKSGRSQSAAWMNAGWKTKNLDMQKQEVTFYRFKAIEENHKGTSHLTLPKAKEELSKTFGVPVENIQITINY